MELVEFLRARLDDQMVRVRVLRTIANGSWRRNLLEVADILERDFEAKRRIIDEHECQCPDPDCGDCGACSGNHHADPTPAPCTTLRLLALPYADAPDYREEWKP